MIFEWFCLTLRLKGWVTAFVDSNVFFFVVRTDERDHQQRKLEGPLLLAINEPLQRQ